MSPRWWPLCQDLLQRGGSSGGQSMDQIFSILNQLCKILNNCHSATFRFKWYDYIFTYTYTYTHYIYIIYIYQIYIYIYRSVVTKIHQNFLSRFGLGLLDQPRLGPFCHFKKGHGRLWVGALFCQAPWAKRWTWDPRLATRGRGWRVERWGHNIYSGWSWKPGN